MDTKRGLVAAVLLLVAAGCGSIEPTIGDLQVSVSVFGGDPDLDGFRIFVDGADHGSVSIDAGATIPGLTAGLRSVELRSVAANCTVSGENPRSVTLVVGDVARVNFVVTCVATGVQVTVVTTGLDPDGDGYTVMVDDGPQWLVTGTGAVTVTRLSAASHTVALTGVAANCTASQPNPRPVSLSLGEIASVDFAVACVAATGTITVTAATSGPEPDPNGYAVVVDAGPSRSLPTNGTRSIEGLAPGNHEVTIAGLDGKCTVAAPNPRTVSVTAGGMTRDTARTTFAVDCPATTGTIRVLTATTGADLDPDGYQVFVSQQPVSPRNIGVNDTLTVPRVAPGPATVTLGGLEANCAESGGSTRTVSIKAGDTTDVAFAVACTALATVQVTTVTTGVDPDPNGYQVLVDGPGGTIGVPILTRGTVTFGRLTPGSISVTLDGVAINCAVAGANPRTVSATSGATAAVTFDVACTATPTLALAMTVNGNTDIYTVKENGSDLTRLTSDPAPDTDPAWSPDGTRIAFVSGRTGNSEIYVMNADGSGQVRLSSAASDWGPAWSPDGQRIAFVSGRDGNPNIYVMNADGTSQVRLTSDPQVDNDPAWSPDGLSIAFSSARDGRSEIYVMSADGSGVSRLTSGGDGDYQPDWSPDGTRIAFSRAVCDYFYYDGCDYRLVIVNSDGSSPTGLGQAGSSVSDPAWSPDGRWIAFGSSAGVMAVRSDGTGLTGITPGDAFQPAWRR